MKINIGAGGEKFEGFVTVDYDKNCNPDYCFDIEKEKWPFEDNSVDQVIAHHVLEHLGEGYFHVMQELYRVCSHGAMIDVHVPHPRHDAFLADPTHRRPITPLGLWLFSKKFNDTHKDTSASRLGYYYDVDFEVTDVVEIPEDFYIKQFNGQPVEKVTQYMYEHNNIIKEFRLKLVVIKE